MSQTSPLQTEPPPADAAIETETQDTDGPAAGAARSGPVIFQALLHPHRSLSPRGFYILMGAIAAVSFTVGGIFFAAGAWPVFGFYGLDVLLVYLFMRANYKSALVYERVRLTEDKLTVERGDYRGLQATYSFQPYWLRLTMDDPPEHHSQIVLTSHGRSLVVGSFLSPEERADFARALRRALDRARAPQTAGAMPV
jgi:uncharacterized membrane protein